MLYYLLFAITLSFIVCQTDEHSRKKHVSQDLSESQISYLSGLSNTAHVNELLDNICIPRVVGTEKHDRVHEYIVSQLKGLGWHAEIDSFYERTPIFGSLLFRNIIATLNPDAERYLVLACHYDSKYFAEFDFEGATDSAVPCAMMLNLIHVMKDELNNYRDLDLKLIFFDGEEAFKTWGKKDSIYGARHLAAEYSRKVVATKSGHQVNELSKIDLFVLLDLLGGPNPVFVSHFKRTVRWHLRLVDSQQRLKNLGLLDQSVNYFRSMENTASVIEDDHIPFLTRGVPILHLIPTPFPEVWHTEGDNRQYIHMPTIENLNRILRVFVAEYLHLSVNSSQ